MCAWSTLLYGVRADRSASPTAPTVAPSHELMTHTGRCSASTLLDSCQNMCQSRQPLPLSRSPLLSALSVSSPSTSRCCRTAGVGASSIVCQESRTCVGLCSLLHLRRRQRTAVNLPQLAVHLLRVQICVQRSLATLGQTRVCISSLSLATAPSAIQLLSFLLNTLLDDFFRASLPQETPPAAGQHLPAPDTSVGLVARTPQPWGRAATLPSATRQPSRRRRPPSARRSRRRPSPPTMVRT